MDFEVYAWIRSNLNKRNQSNSMNEQVFGSSIGKCGVPQESILLLSIIYINDFPNACRNTIPFLNHSIPFADNNNCLCEEKKMNNGHSSLRLHALLFSRRILVENLPDSYSG